MDISKELLINHINSSPDLLKLWCEAEKYCKFPLHRRTGTHVHGSMVEYEASNNRKPVPWWEFPDAQTKLDLP